MKVLGIDYSLNGTGLSVYDGKDIVFKKVFTTVKKNYETDKETFILSPKFDKTEEKIDWVCETIVESTDYDFVCIEDHIGSYYDWMDGYAIVKHLLRKKQAQYLMISPTMLKKFAGCGKADKNQMSYYLNYYYGFDLDYIGKLANNIVDATWLAIVGYNYYQKYILKNPIELSPERELILAKLAKKEK